ncbi:MAG: hypothetical protein AB1509_15670 [Chloroflexota bacterium]
MKTKLPLPEAQKIAARVIDALAPHCQRIEVAGSIRRQSPQVGDIEIVCQPKTGADLFGQSKTARYTAPLRTKSSQRPRRAIFLPSAGLKTFHHKKGTEHV